MPNLQPYLNFSVALDNTGATPVLRITDLSTYPGVTSITGTFSIVQPDGGYAIAAPTATLLTISPYTAALRLASDGTFQNGLYTITYNVVDNTSFNSVLAKSFTLSIFKPVAVLKPVILPYLPSVTVEDDTVYIQPGLTVTGTSRVWYGNIQGVGSISNYTLPIFDLIYGGFYYNTGYSGNLNTTITYTVNAATWVTVLQKTAGTFAFSVYAPVTLDIFLQHINELWKNITTGCGCNDTTKADFTYIWSLFNMYKDNGNCGYTADQLTMYNELCSLLNIFPSTALAELVPYSFSDYCGCCGDSVSPTPPQTQLATPLVLLTPTFTSILASWVAVPNAVTYTVEWSTVSNFASIAGSSVVSAPTVSLNALGLNAVTHYYFRVKAFAPTYIDSLFGYADATTIAVQTKLVTPLVSLAVLTPTSIAVFWNTVINATQYRIDWSLTADFAVIYGSTSVQQGTVTCTATGLIAMTTFYFRVIATAPTYIDSDYGYASIATNIQLGQPELDCTIPSSPSVHAAWTSVNNAVTYLLQWSLVSNFSTIVGSATTHIPDLSYDTAALSNSTLYYFRVKAMAPGWVDGNYGYDTITTGVASATLYWGLSPVHTLLNDASILAGIAQSFTPGSTSVTIDMRSGNTTPRYFWFAIRNTEVVKTRYYESVSNTGAIGAAGAGTFWELLGTVVADSGGADWNFYMISYASLFPLSQNPFSYYDV